MQPRYGWIGPFVGRSSCTVVALCWTLAALASAAVLPPQPGGVEFEDRLTQLVAELGAEQYAIRERAQLELQRMGVAAFDVLLEAQYHEDVEIATRARYILRSIRIPWVAADDPPDIKTALQNFEDASREDRQRRIQQLAQPDIRSIAALCRVMRFELDPVLSKLAACRAMATAPPEGMGQRREIAAAIRSNVTGSRRRAGRWLLVYARTLEDPLSTLDDWARLTAEEIEVLSRYPEETDERVVRDLLRLRTEILLRLDRPAEALAVLRQTLPLLGDDREQLLETLDWSVAHAVWPMVDDVAQRFAEQFESDPLLLYRWAEAQRLSGRRELGELTAQRALAINANRPEQHVETARKLIERMLYDWAEREARHVVDASEATEETGLEARLLLSDLLFDLEQELAAAEVLRETVDALSKDDRVLQAFNRPLSVVRSLMHYRYAVHLARTGDRSHQRKRLEEAIRQHPVDVDVLIAMYRLSETETDWRSAVLARVNAVAGRLRDEIREQEELAQNPLNQRFRPDIARPLASRLNQYAWLVSNTEGDFQEALRASRRSLELSPDNPAFLDTLGRCYYAVGDLENAIRYQSRAVQLEPSTQQMRRQLELFQQEKSAPANAR